ncbi:protein translocase subunit SecD [Neiella marina]|uniref:Protein translocase subunit SecD n=1 Tax=Neiella marina TaxID=508461 RepID=A0A8J2U269_9GAMM|nr:protein translocase subunit SecD [Neiella marina]GGA65816.1 protein translocase subunit SecD [Neiella marina]
MLNTNPIWKVLMVILVVAICALYASPNLYGEDPAVQISAARGATVEAQTLDTVKQALEAEGVEYKRLTLENNQIELRLLNSDQQLPVRELVANALGDRFVVALNLAPATPEWLESLGASPMKLGLDLRGGVHFLMEVDMGAAIAKTEEQMVQDFRSDLREEGVRYKGIRQRSQGGVELRFRDEAGRDEGTRALERKYPDLVFTDTDSDTDTIVTMSEQKLKETRDYAVQQNITIIRNRVNELGVAEPLVQRQGADRIVVELPGVQDTARAKEILGATATLEFRMQDTKGDVAAAVGGRSIPGSRLFTDRDGRPVLLKNRVILTGDHIVGAQSGFDEYSRPQVNISLDGKGGNKMAAATKDAIGQPMATVFIEYKPTGKRDADGRPIFDKQEEVVNVATIQARLGRSFRITGIDSQAEAHNLALVLRAGALIAPIQIVEERTVGPSMGAENIERGLTSIIYGLAATIAFMLFYYRGFGLVANVALVMNLVLIVGVMSMLPGATLSLPGIAGIVLTIGTAVDANVLIFERIREELRAGRSVQQSIHMGYSNALSSIADANITTFITAVILFSIGSGPVKGFALTLAIGLATSMFTAIVGTRLVVNSVWGGRRLDKLPI